MNYNELFYAMKQINASDTVARYNDYKIVHNQFMFLITHAWRVPEYVSVFLWTINYLKYNCYEL